MEQKSKDRVDFEEMIRQEQIRDVQQTIQFYKTAPLSALLADARKYNPAIIKQIEYSAYNKVKDYKSLEEDEKNLFKWKIRKGVIFNLGLLGVYKIMSNPKPFNINMRYFGRIVQFLTYKKGVFLWLLSPVCAHYDYQELVLRLGMKYYLIEQNKSILFNQDGSLYSAAGANQKENL